VDEKSEKSEELFKEFLDLVKKLRHESSGVPLKERSWRYRKYENCFLGKDAVDWFVNNSYANNRENAAEIGKRMIDESVIVYLGKGTEFKEENFYRFVEHEDVEKKEKKGERKR